MQIAVYWDAKSQIKQGEARWRSGKASDSGSRGPWFGPNWRQYVAPLSKAHTDYWLVTRKRWLHPEMTEKLLILTLILKTKQKSNKII